MRSRTIPALAAACLLAACASTGGPVAPDHSTGVGQRMIQPEGSARYDMSSHQAFVMPLPEANPAPVFPAGYPLQDLSSTTVCTSLVVGADGGVRDVTPLDAPGCQAPGQVPEAFGEAVRAAVSGWRFSPAMFCTYPDAATRDRDWTGQGCAGAVTTAEAVPVTLAWAFTFEVRHGQGHVSSQSTRVN